MEYVESVIIGGGQSGLATSYYLAKEGREHMIFDKASKPASAWREGRWDSFTLVTPNWTVRMPGIPEREEDRDGFMPLKEVISFFENYINEFNLPVKLNTEVTSIEKTENGYLVKTNGDTYKTKNVVIATGFFQKPRIPVFASSMPGNIIQMTNGEYRNPRQLPEGAVLIVGSGQSGCQIAEELYKSGRKVFLSTGCTSGRVPRRYRGKDIIEWLELMGFFNLPFDQMPPGTGKFNAIPHVSGAGGGHTINLHRFKREGVKLLGHLREAREGKVLVAPDLYENLARIDQFDANTRDNIDGFIQNSGLKVPDEESEIINDGYYESITEMLDFKKENITSVIWSCGYSFDYSMVKMPVYDNIGFPIQDSGKTQYPGLYFVGLPWAPNQRSGFLIGMAEYAKDIAYDIIEKNI